MNWLQKAAAWLTAPSTVQAAPSGRKALEMPMDRFWLDGNPALTLL